jgi:mannose-6-phosphate isomerase-like protein (cupin superfamily)
MNKLTRRELCAALPALASITTLAQDQTAAVPNPLSQSRAYPVDQMPVRKMANGGESRDVLHGAISTGEIIGVHESSQPAGMQPNPAHTIQHTEVIVVIQGTLAFEHDGKTEKVGPGGVLYVANGTLHSVRNVGDDTARYCVVQIGGDTRK